MVATAPRYPERLLGLIEELDDDVISLAEVARRVGAAAERAGITRPSPVHVRALAAERRWQRAEDRAARRAALEEMTRLLPYTIGNAYEAAVAAEQAREGARARRRRRAS